MVGPPSMARVWPLTQADMSVAKYKTPARDVLGLARATAAVPVFLPTQASDRTGPTSAAPLRKPRRPLRCSCSGCGGDPIRWRRLG